MINTIKQFKNIIYFYSLLILFIFYVSAKIKINISEWNNNELIVFLIILGSFNIHKVSTIFNVRKEPKIFWVNIKLLTRYVRIIFFKLFGRQFLIVNCCLIILFLSKMIRIDYFILALLYFPIMNFGVLLTKFYFYIFNILSLLFPSLLVVNISWINNFRDLLLYLIVIIMYLLILFYLFNPDIIFFQIYNNYSFKFNFESVGQEKVLLKKILHHRISIFLIFIIDLTMISLSNLFNAVQLINPASITVIFFITILEAFIGNNLNELDLDKYRLKTLISNFNTSFFSRFISSTIYYWCFLLSLNILFSSILQCFLTNNISSLTTIIYIPCLLSISIIYYRKSELILTRSKINTKFIIFIAYLIAIFGGIIVEIYTKN